MISIIISTYRSVLLEALKSNIEETIGVPFEVIAIPNKNGEKGICEVYNIAASKSKFPYLCFIHEDINFLTPNWGTSIIAFYSREINIGVVGLAGSTYKPKMISSWWQPLCRGYEPKRSNIIQHFKFQKKEKQHIIYNPKNENASLVASLDGVFLFTAKAIWEKHPFDQNLLDSFHAYDLDFTLNIGKRYNNYVIYNVLIEHFSEGNYNDFGWLKQNYLVHKKFESILPVIKDDSIDTEIIKESERYWCEIDLNILTHTNHRQKAANILIYLISSSKFLTFNIFFLKMIVKFFLSSIGPFYRKGLNPY